MPAEAHITSVSPAGGPFAGGTRVTIFGHSFASLNNLSSCRFGIDPVAATLVDGGAVACLSDQDIIDLLMKELLPSAVPGFKHAKVLDAHVAR